MKNILPLLILSVVALASHLMLLPHGFAILDSEWAVFLLWADRMRNGHWSAFPFQQNYGGALLTTLRAVWVQLVGNATKQNFVSAQLSFSYLVCPILMSWASYFLVRQYCSRMASYVIGIVCAVGFQFWVFQYGNDFYPAYYILGCLLLGWRAHFNNPFLELSRRSLFAVGVLCGLMFYTSRATQIFIVAFFIPWPWAWQELKTLWCIKNVWLRRFLYVGVFMICLGVYLEVFGRDVGQMAGRQLKLDGKPNHQIGLYIVALVWCLSRFKLLRRESIARAAVLLAGFIVGFLPELSYQLARGRLTSEMQFSTQNFETSMRILAATPEALTVLVSGKQFFRGLAFTDDGVGRHFSVFLLLAGMWCFGERLFLEKRQTRPSLAPLAMVFALSLYGFCRIFTRVPEFAPPRYLFPVFPMIVVCFGVFWDRIWQKQGQQFLKVVVSLIFVAHCGHQLSARFRLAEVAQKSGRLEMAQEVVLRARQLGAKVVISDDFWHGNTYGVISQGSPYFWTNWRDWGAPEGKDFSLHEKRVGVFLPKGSSAAKEGEITLMGRRFRLTAFATIGDRELFVGDAF